jgi:bacteriocin-like protein
MTNKDPAKKPASENASKSHKPDAELQENELEQISGGVALAKPTNPRRKNPNMFISEEGP